MVALILSSIGGVVTLLGAALFVGRSIFHQVDSTDRNTAAVTLLNDTLGKVIDRLTNLETRVTVLEDRAKRP